MLWLHQSAHATCHPLSGQNPPLATLQLLLQCADQDTDVPLLWLLPEAAEQTLVALLQSAAAAAAADQIVGFLLHVAADNYTVALLVPAAVQTFALPWPAADQTVALPRWFYADLTADCIAALDLWSRHKE